MLKQCKALDLSHNRRSTPERSQRTSSPLAGGGALGTFGATGAFPNVPEAPRVHLEGGCGHPGWSGFHLSGPKRAGTPLPAATSAPTGAWKLFGRIKIKATEVNRHRTAPGPLKYPEGTLSRPVPFVTCRAVGTPPPMEFVFGSLGVLSAWKRRV